MHECTAVHVCGEDGGVDGIVDTDGQAGIVPVIIYTVWTLS